MGVAYPSYAQAIAQRQAEGALGEVKERVEFRENRPGAAYKRPASRSSRSLNSSANSIRTGVPSMVSTSNNG